jgi:uncharacterized protein
MQKRAFIIHGWDATPDSDWYPWLKQELERKGFDVQVPAMPDTEAPEINKWLDRLIKVMGQPDEKTFFIGHSIGCQTILRYLSSLFDVHVGGVICVAPWFSLQDLADDEEWTVAKPWLETPLNYHKARHATTKLTAIFSDNDPFVPLEANRKIFRDKLGAQVIVQHNKGHFRAEDDVREIPLILDLLTES